jgi:hypothetical protein
MEHGIGERVQNSFDVDLAEKIKVVRLDPKYHDHCLHQI